MKIKIATWNMAHRKCFDESWSYYINEINADIFFFQEARQPKIKEGNLIWHNTGKEYWGTGIYSKKYELSEETIPLCKPELRGTCVIANSKINEETKLTLISLYGLWEKTWGKLNFYSITNLHRMLSDLTGILNSHINGRRKIILGGDFNADIQWDQEHGGNDNKIFFDRLKDFKLVNCFEPFYTEFVQTYRRPHSKRLWQDDYFFISKSISKRLINCEVIDNDKIRKYSDHNPVVITLDL
jgi:exodeoxyribonuclease-3